MKGFFFSCQKKKWEERRLVGYLFQETKIVVMRPDSKETGREISRREKWARSECLIRHELEGERRVWD